MSETMGRCRSEVDDCYGGLPLVAIADAIDRLAADVAAVKEAVCDGSVAEERDRFFAGWAYALNERAKLRAEVERLKAELAARQAAAPPGVVLPTVFQHSSLGDKLVALQQVKDALDKAGVPWIGGGA